MNGTASRWGERCVGSCVHLLRRIGVGGHGVKTTASFTVKSRGNRAFTFSRLSEVIDGLSRFFSLERLPDKNNQAEQSEKK